MGGVGWGENIHDILQKAIINVDDINAPLRKAKRFAKIIMVFFKIRSVC